MDRNIYATLNEIKETKSTESTSDIRFLGTINMENTDITGAKVDIAKDIFVVIDSEQETGDTVEKFYDENQDLIAYRDKEGRLFPTEKYMNENIGFLSEIDNLELEGGISLEELDKKLDEVSKALGISKSDVLSMTEVELDQVIEDKDSIGLDLSQDEQEKDGVNQEEINERNNEALENINSRQEINLDEKVDERRTLAEILGIEAGCKLLAVDSDKIIGNKNTTRFSLVIQGPDGSLRQADMLEQVGGKDSDKTIYETNRDGSKVEKLSVKSSYAINSPLVKNGIITVRYGDTGRLKVSYGLTDPTSHRDAVAQELRGREIMYRTERDVREEFGPYKGNRDVTKKIDEAERHPEEEFENKQIDLNDIDGDLSTRTFSWRRCVGSN